MFSRGLRADWIKSWRSSNYLLFGFGFWWVSSDGNYLFWLMWLWRWASNLSFIRQDILSRFENVFRFCVNSFMIQIYDSREFNRNELQRTSNFLCWKTVPYCLTTIMNFYHWSTIFEVSKPKKIVFNTTTLLQKFSWTWKVAAESKNYEFLSDFKCKPFRSYNKLNLIDHNLQIFSSLKSIEKFH